jgi:erythrocyte band 7 integral membrane protein
LLTLDAVTVRVDSFINYKVVDPYIVTFKVKSYKNVILLYLQETMKSVFSSYKLSDIVKNRKEVEGQMTGILKGFLLPYGLFILQCNTSTIDLPERLDRAMAAESEATKKARAKIIDAQANLNTAKQMRESADEFSKNTVSLELQFYDVIKHMLRVGDSQVILPDSILGKL